MSRTYLNHWPSTSVEEPVSTWGEGTFRRILVAFDGSDSSWKALRMAISLAWQHDAELVMLSVEDGLPRFPATVGEVQEEKEREDDFYARLHEQARRLAEGRGVKIGSAVMPGRPATAIVHYAREGAFDLVVLGASSKGWVWDSVFGVGARVGRDACCSVMIVR